MSIDENGFLDPDATTWIEKYRSDYKELFKICESINGFAQTHLHKITVHNEDIQEVLVALLFVRALSAHQASILLIERGLSTEPRIILRNHLEILFKLRAVSLDREVAKAYVFEDEVSRKKFINKFKLLSDDVKQAQGNQQLDDLLKTIKQNIDANEIVERKTQWYAHKAKLDDYYNSAYSYFSGAVHANVRELQELVTVDQHGKIGEILYGPDRATDVDKLLLTGGETQCLVLQDVSRTFALKVEDTIAELHKKLKAIVQK